MSSIQEAAPKSLAVEALLVLNGGPVSSDAASTSGDSTDEDGGRAAAHVTDNTPPSTPLHEASCPNPTVAGRTGQGARPSHSTAERDALAGLLGIGDIGESPPKTQTTEDVPEMVPNTTGPKMSRLQAVLARSAAIRGATVSGPVSPADVSTPMLSLTVKDICMCPSKSISWAKPASLSKVQEGPCSHEDVKRHTDGAPVFKWRAVGEPNVVPRENSSVFKWRPMTQASTPVGMLPAPPHTHPQGMPMPMQMHMPTMPMPLPMPVAPPPGVAPAYAPPTPTAPGFVPGAALAPANSGTPGKAGKADKRARPTQQKAPGAAYRAPGGARWNTLVSFDGKVTDMRRRPDPATQPIAQPGAQTFMMTMPMGVAAMMEPPAKKLRAWKQLPKY